MEIKSQRSETKEKDVSERLGQEVIQEKRNIAEHRCKV
jgi:hypothetical protein